MQFVVCDSIDLTNNGIGSSCVGAKQVVDYIPPVINSGGTTAMDAVTIDPWIAARFFMMGFGVIAAVLIGAMIMKYLFKEFMENLDKF